MVSEFKVLNESSISARGENHQSSGDCRNAKLKYHTRVDSCLCNGFKVKALTFGTHSINCFFTGLTPHPV